MPSSEQHIVASCGGFGMEPENLVLDKFVLGLARTADPRVCFIPTASGDNDNYIRRFYQAFTTLECRPSHLSLFKPPTSDLDGFIREQDVVYVGGGNTRNMLLIWREWLLDQSLRAALESGTVLAGLSAGAICWFEEGVTDSFGPENASQLTAMTCLGFLPGSHCPYYDSPKRRSEYHRLLLSGDIISGLATDVGAALHFANGQLAAAVASRSSAKAYRVESAGGEIHAESIPTRVL